MKNSTAAPRLVRITLKHCFVIFELELEARISMVKMKRWETLSAVRVRLLILLRRGGGGHILFSVAIKLAAAAEPSGYDPAIPGELNPWDPEDGKNEGERMSLAKGECNT